MGEKPKVLLVATLDSKEVETRFIRERLEDSGLEVYLLDASIRRTIDGGAHITPDQIAAAVGTTMPEIRALNHEGKCMALMIEGAIKCAHELHERVGLSGVIAAGGSGGTTLGSAVMRTFPFGLPKVMISTMASGMTKPFVGTKDIVMLNSVCDVAGLNTGHPTRVSRTAPWRLPAWLMDIRPRGFGQTARGDVDPQHHGQVLQQGTRGARAEWI